MDVNRLRMLSRIAALSFAEEPSGDSGGADGEDTAPKDSEQGGPKDGDRGNEDDDSEDEGDDSDGEGEDGWKPITTRAEFDRILGRRLRREREKFADYEDLKQRVSDQENTISELQTKLDEHDLQDLVKQVAEKHGVPGDILRGTTKEELTAHAEQLRSAFDKSEEDDRTATRRGARSPLTGTGDERPQAPSQQQGREAARAYLDKTNRKGKAQ